jgi:hypothetical protein
VCVCVCIYAHTYIHTELSQLCRVGVAFAPNADSSCLLFVRMLYAYIHTYTLHTYRVISAVWSWGCFRAKHRHNIYINMHIYIYIYIYIHTHTRTYMHTELSQLCGVGVAFAPNADSTCLLVVGMQASGSAEGSGQVYIHMYPCIHIHPLSIHTHVSIHANVVSIHYTFMCCF